MRTLDKEFGSIGVVAQKAINEAKKDGEEVRFFFNEVELIVHPESYARDICEIYFLKLDKWKAKW